jgi:3-oxoacyl-[acyl-carrier-protein] synthase II
MLFANGKMKNRVYIIDYELISPISVGRNSLFENLRNNNCADRKIKRCNVEAIPFKKGAEVQEDISAFYSGESDRLKKTCQLDRKLELLVACYGLAAERLQPLIEKMPSARTGVLTGVGADIISLEYFEKELGGFIKQGLNPVQELISSINTIQGNLNLLNNPYDVHSIFLAEKFKAAAFQQTLLTACVSSTQALAFGYDAIAENRCDVVVAGGTDSLINMLALISFGKLGVIAESNDQVSCRPFDVNRMGALAGECAGFAILASEKFVNENKLAPIAEFLGYGNTLDAYKITAPDPGGISISKSIRDAVSNSGIDATQIDYINAHGTGTKQNDHVELKCIENALGSIAKEIPISSTKDRHGHAIAAAGIQELCVVLECFKNNFIPANLNLQKSCDNSFDLVRENRLKKIKYALTSNFAFGGINTVLALKNES